jgi:hypothetical protein
MAKTQGLRAPVDEGAPIECPRGHAMRAGQTIVGWSPCQCPPCLKRGHGLRGHRTYLCRDCHDDGYTTVAYFPYHVPAEDAEIRWP